TGNRFEHLTCTVVRSTDYLSGSRNRSTHSTVGGYKMTPNALPETRSRAKSKTIMMFSTLLVVFTMILAACGSSGQNNPGSTTKHVLTVASQSNDFSQAGLNPFNTKTDVGVQGLI